MLGGSNADIENTLQTLLGSLPNEFAGFEVIIDCLFKCNFNLIEGFPFVGDKIGDEENFSPKNLPFNIGLYRAFVAFVFECVHRGLGWLDVAEGH